MASYNGRVLSERSMSTIQASCQQLEMKNCKVPNLKRKIFLEEIYTGINRQNKATTNGLKVKEPTT